MKPETPPIAASNTASSSPLYPDSPRKLRTPTTIIRPKALGSMVVAASLVLFASPVVVETQAFDLQNIVGTQTQMIRREATEYQRKVAEARARAYVAAQVRAQSGTASSKPGKSGASTPKGKKAESQSAQAKLPRYIAVETAKDKHSPPGTTPVMVWDTRSETLVNNSIYDVSNPPAVGATEKFDTYSAQFIGSGVASTR